MTNSRVSHTISQDSQWLNFFTFGYKTLQEIATFGYDRYGKYAEDYQVFDETSHNTMGIPE